MAASQGTKSFRTHENVDSGSKTAPELLNGFVNTLHIEYLKFQNKGFVKTPYLFTENYKQKISYCCYFRMLSESNNLNSNRVSVENK